MTFNVNRDAIWEKVRALPPNIVVVECDWDGDSSGWAVRILAIEELAPDSYQKHLITYVAHGLGEFHDFMRSLVGKTPPYPEGQLAQAIGQEIADHLHVPLYFPSPEKPSGPELPEWLDWREGRLSSIPIRVVNPQIVIEQFASARVAVVEAYWAYYFHFYPGLSVVTIEPTDGQKSPYAFNGVGGFNWDEEDRGKTIRGIQVPQSTPVEEAIRVGTYVAKQLRVPFIFNSPDQPSHHLPSWIDLHKPRL